MIWNLFIAVYAAVALFSMCMTLREYLRSETAQIGGALMGIVGCAFWPAAVVAVGFGASMERRSDRAGLTV